MELKLKEKLENLSLHWKKGEEKELEAQFKELAPYFLSEAYIKVREDYRVYPTTIEFYFHSEKEDGIKDPIVYHRNNNKVKGDIPYFPLMTLHAHDSGYDITFENEKEQYRASVLIREYQVWDENHKYWLKWDSEMIQLPSGAEEKQFKFRKYKESDKTPINNQVLYLKYILNSFPMNGENLISWENAKEELPFKFEKEDGKPRQNVPKYEMKNGNFEKIIKGHTPKGKEIYEPCDRQWSFSRKEFIKEPRD